jgi:flavin reductase (DIM6/NTAB) family NADH-FMN oxidoreductase RutF
MELAAAELTTRDAYRLMIGAIVPRAIAWVSSVSPAGLFNLAPYSFFTGVCPSPPTICFSVVDGPERLDGKKDTLRNVEHQREFVVNVVSEAVAEAMNLTSGEYQADVDEFQLAGLTPAASACVSVPRVAEAPIALECRLVQVVPVGRPPSGAGLVIGEIVHFHVADELYENGRINIHKLRPVGRLAGDSYSRTREIFELIRPNPNYIGR